MQNYEENDNVYESDELEDNMVPKFSYEVTSIPVDNLVPFSNHPFKVADDDALKMLTDDIAANGLINPIVVRKKVMSGCYEILSGHRRLTAAKRLGWSKIDAHIVIANDCQAANIVIRSNFSQRDKILPSEKAKSYQLRNETLKEEKYGEYSPGGNGSDNLIYQELEAEFNEGKTTIFRYMRLNYLIDDLLSLVDEGKILIKIGESLSYFSTEEQKLIYRYFFVEKRAKLDAIIVHELRNLGKEITEAALDELMTVKTETKKTPVKIVKRYRKYFDNDEDAEKKIIEILDAYFAKLERQSNKGRDTKISEQQENGNAANGENQKRQNQPFNRHQGNQQKNKKNHNNSGDTKPQS